MISNVKLAAQLLKNALRFRYQKWTGHPGKPQAVSLEITHDCIAKCIMCNIWKIPSDVPNLPVEGWQNLLSSDVFFDLRELDITGGEPFLKLDLLDLFSHICEQKGHNLKNLRSIAITTNGFLTRRVLRYTEEILKQLAECRIELVMVCAMDGIGETHDKIRNVEDAWKKVNETVQGLLKLRARYPNLIIGLKTTILPINVGELDGIVQYADAKGLFTIISPCIITRGRYLNQDSAENLKFSKEDVAKMIHFFQGQRFKWSFHGDSLAQYLNTGTMQKPCSCGFNYFFVRSSGDVHLCPLLDFTIGNIKEREIEDLLSSKKAARVRRRIGQYPECSKCTEPGLERYSLPYEGLHYLSLLLKMGKKGFLQMHSHLGLDKYL